VSIVSELKRLKTKALWLRVWHYTRFKFDGESRKQLTKAVPKEDWLPISISVLIGVLLVVLLVNLGFFK
jgi:hypothetical protein